MTSGASLRMFWTERYTYWLLLSAFHPEPPGYRLRITGDILEMTR